MSTIFELSQEKQALLDMLCFEEDDEQAKFRLNIINGTIQHKLAYVTDLLAEAQGQVTLSREALIAAQYRLSVRLKRAERTEQRLKQFLLDSMALNDIYKVEGDIINVSRYLTQGSLVVDTELLPEDCFETVKVVAKNIKERLLDGEEIPGAEIVKKMALRVS